MLIASNKIIAITTQINAIDLAFMHASINIKLFSLSCFFVEQRYAIFILFKAENDLYLAAFVAYMTRVSVSNVSICEYN